ncbi:Ku protein [Rhizobiaceae bacterium n13]|uniref:Non-homologous end joining protein Ku n=1 Tax=Ferirhizobium litorale TaxID=2927786 RepID=A0AAE3U2E3_9HYPH|nr:Ku protein [Fererhizobium litorale]MDI7862096.1 Ku protein [Fererhizobium litorale]MDI7922632.1 Ku protein [Fererhizobium litorale]
MVARATWKGQLKIGALTCPVGLYTAVSSADHISLNIVNRKTGNRVERQFVDSETGKPVDKENQVKGYQLDSGDYVLVEGDELAAIVPDSDKVLSVEEFVPVDEIDKTYFERPYYLVPTDRDELEVAAVLMRGMEATNSAAIAHAVLFRKHRSLLIRPHEKVLIATVLAFDYEVRSAATTFKDIPEMDLTEEMIELAGHIISTRKGSFDPARFEDRYEAALLELVKAKMEGRQIEARPAKAESKVIDLMEALRLSAAAAKPAKSKAAARDKGGSGSKKAG